MLPLHLVVHTCDCCFANSTLLVNDLVAARTAISIKVFCSSVRVGEVSERDVIFPSKGVLSFCFSVSCCISSDFSSEATGASVGASVTGDFGIGGSSDVGKLSVFSSTILWHIKVTFRFQLLNETLILSSRQFFFLFNFGLCLRSRFNGFFDSSNS
uniref:Candidate secreted effector n=1 Tax=Meloidogyne incognita TaxID=6306 RepID=A0A914NDC8_MELIC